MTLGGGSPSQSESALLALNKRKAQLERWRGSDTEKESTEIKSRPKRVKFADKCIFQAACASGDKGQVARMIKEGYDINAVDEDGITALHQACIEDNFDMVEFLLQNGADVNISDNEGWTPLHAVATCCYVSIAKLLLEHGANVVALNNDCSIPLDICKSEEIRELFIQEINGKGIDLKDARRGEELKMLDDAKRWVASGVVDEAAHPITGATAMHVAACKGYIKVLDLLIKAGANMNAQDFDGWTPLHAAAHWGQKEACEVLLENMCDMGIRNNCDQTALDISDDSVVPLLEEWKKKHDVNKNIDNKQQSLNNNNNNVQPVPKKKSVPQRPDTSSEHDVTIVASQLGQGDVSNKSSAPPHSDETHAEIEKSSKGNVAALDGGVEETTNEAVDEEAEDTLSELPSSTTQETGGVVVTAPESISFTHSHLHGPSSAVTQSQPTATSISVTVSTDPPASTTATSSASINHTISSSSAITSSSDKSSDRTTVLDKRVDTTATHQIDESNTGLHPHSWRRGGSLRTRTTTAVGTASSSTTSSSTGGAEDGTAAAASSNKGTSERLTVRRTQSAATTADSSLRRAYSFESDAKFYSRLRDARERIKAMEDASARLSSETNTTRALSSSSSTTPSTTTTTVTPAGTVGTGSSASYGGSSGLSSSDALTSSLLAPSLTRHSRLRSAGLTSSSATTSSSLSSSTNSSNVISTRRGGGGVGGATNNSHSLTITTPALLLSNSTESSSSIISSSSHNAVVEPPPPQEEDDLFSTVILRRSKENEANRPHHRPNTMGSPNPSSRATSTNTPTTTNTTTSSLPQNYSETKQTRRSFVPPTRDEESETQRKAHAKRVRETRRSTQGVTLEELKSAEQYMKNSQTSGGSNASGSTNTSTVPVSSSGRKDQQLQDDANVERRPSWRLRVDEQDRSKFSLEDTRQQGGAGAAAGSSTSLASNPSSSSSVPTSRSGGYHSEIPYGLAQRNPSLRSKLGKGMLIDQTMLANTGPPSANSSGASSSTPQGKPPIPGGDESTTAQQQEDDRDVRNSGGAQGAILRKKKTKRRSTGVVQFNTDIGREVSSDVEGPESSNRSENGVTQRINYKKLYEEVLKENQQLKSKLSRAEEDIAELKLKLDKLSMTPRITTDDTEKMEKRALERKLSEMEEELKQMQRLKLDSEKLKAENRALTRVVSKLSGNSNGGVIGSGHGHTVVASSPPSSSANTPTVTANGNGHATTSTGGGTSNEK